MHDPGIAFAPGKKGFVADVERQDATPARSDLASRLEKFVICVLSFTPFASVWTNTPFSPRCLVVVSRCEERHHFASCDQRRADRERRLRKIEGRITFGADSFLNCWCALAFAVGKCEHECT